MRIEYTSECMYSKEILHSRSLTHQEVHSRSERESRVKSALIANPSSIYTPVSTSMKQLLSLVPCGFSPKQQMNLFLVQRQRPMEYKIK